MAYENASSDARRRHRRQGRIAVAVSFALVAVSVAVAVFVTAGSRDTDVGTADGVPWPVFAAASAPVACTALLLFWFGRSRARAVARAERLARELVASQARTQAVMDSSLEAIVTVGDDGAIETANLAAERLFGWSAGELCGVPLDEVLPAGVVGRAVASEASTPAVLQAHRRDGSTLSIEVTVVPNTVGDRPTSVVIARDATFRRPHDVEPTHRATHDALTGLANRALFEDLLVRAVFRGDRARTPVAVLSVDLDGFEDVNEAFGRQAGDRVLAEAGRRLESAVRPGDLVARLGGDGFAVICESLLSAGDAETIAGRVVEAVCRGIPVASGVASVTVSIGVAVGRPGEGAASLLERAEAAMDRMKQEGKAGYRLADAPAS